MSIRLEKEHFISEPSYIVFKSDDGLYYAVNQETKDILAKNADAATVIQSAIASTSNGKIVFRGEFNITKTIVIDSENIVLQGGKFVAKSNLDGMGVFWVKGGSNIKFCNMYIDAGYDDGYQAEPIRIYSTNRDIKRVVVERCYLRNSYYQGVDITGSGSLGYYVYNVTVKDCFIEHIRLNGVYVGINSGRVVIEGNFIEDIISDNPSAPTEGSGIMTENNEYGDIIIKNNIIYKSNYLGISLVGAQKPTYKVVIEGNILLNITKTALNTAVDRLVKSLKINNNYFDNGISIFLPSDAESVIVEGNRVEGDATGIYVDGYDAYGTNLIVANNIIIPTQHGLYLRYVDKAIVVGNRIHTPGSGYRGIQLSYVKNSKIMHNIIDGDINELDNCENNDIEYNTVTNITSAGSGTKVKFNRGYVTENSGIATIPAGSTRVTVNHGLASTPSKVLVTPIGDPGDRFWVENVGSSSFDIVVAAAPGADIDFYWQAEV